MWLSSYRAAYNLFAARTITLRYRRSYHSAMTESFNGLVPPSSKRPAEGSTDNTTLESLKRAKTRHAPNFRFQGTNEDVLAQDLTEYLHTFSLPATSEPLPARFTEVTVQIRAISSTGDGLGDSPSLPCIFVVPFTFPGDVVCAKVIRHVTYTTPAHIAADFVSVITHSERRNDSLIRCRYFAQCGGCQLQMVSYDDQREHKRRVLKAAFRHFSGVPLEALALDSVKEIIPSPLQYSYRTKLTPHFDGPRNARKAAKGKEEAHWDRVPAIGFMAKGQRKTLDIEECPIGTEAVQMGLRRERSRVSRDINKYKKGATLLLRESTDRLEKTDTTLLPGLNEDTQTVYEDRGEHMHAKTCVTDSKHGETTEYIGDFVFRNSANAFFQNNNSILPDFTDYIRRNILPADLPTTTTVPTPKIQYLIDAYSGSGLFTITLSSLFTRSIGIDIAPASIASARENAALNGIPASRVDFLAADASALFSSVADFPPAETAVVLDPPRKGCDIPFLTQLLAFSPARIVYVSCNVHTQARDIGWLLRNGREVDEADDVEAAVAESPYEMESLRGFDFFPQTGHVEGVAVLRRKQDAKSGG